MNIIALDKSKREIKFKVCGLTLFHYSTDKKDEYTKIKLFFNLIYYKYDIFFTTFNLRICGLNILRTKIAGSYKVWYFLFLPIYLRNETKKFRNTFLDKIINKYPQYDDYYIFLSRSGEFFLLMHHLKEWLTKNNSTNFMLVFTAKYHLNICKMFFPEVPMTYIKKTFVSLISRGVKSTNFKYKEKNIFVPTNEDYFVDVENKIRNKNGHYYELLKQHLNLSDKTGSYIISDKTKNKIKKIVKYILNDNFVFVSPETLSNEPMEKDFWSDLCKEIRKMGYEIFCNAMEFKNLIDDTQATFLTYEESIELAKYAKAIIGMRSGFTECLSQNNVPLIVLYTDFPKRSGFKRLQSDKVLSGFTISKLPNVNNSLLHEYDVNKYIDKNLIISEIIDLIKSRGELNARFTKI